jgi:hypothetical protein
MRGYTRPVLHEYGSMVGATRKSGNRFDFETFEWTQDGERPPWFCDLFPFLCD